MTTDGVRSDAPSGTTSRSSNPERTPGAVRPLAVVGLIGAAAALPLPWWTAGNATASPTHNGLFPMLAAALALIAVAATDLLLHATVRRGSSVHLVAAALAATVGAGIVGYCVVIRWGEASRGIGQVVALVATTATLMGAVLSLGPSRAPRRSPAPAAPVEREAPTPSSPVPDLPTPVIPSQATPLPSPAPAPAGGLPAPPFRFRVPAATPLFTSDGVNAVGLLQPGQWYVASGVTPDWVAADDQQGHQGWVHAGSVRAGSVQVDAP